MPSSQRVCQIQRQTVSSYVQILCSVILSVWIQVWRYWPIYRWATGFWGRADDIQKKVDPLIKKTVKFKERGYQLSIDFIANMFLPFKQKLQHPFFSPRYFVDGSFFQTVTSVPAELKPIYFSPSSQVLHLSLFFSLFLSQNFLDEGYGRVCDPMSFQLSAKVQAVR